jgi:hypothetical protein
MIIASNPNPNGRDVSYYSDAGQPSLVLVVTSPLAVEAILGIDVEALELQPASTSGTPVGAVSLGLWAAPAL